MFSSDINEIRKSIDRIDPIKYGKTRNYINGSVTKLSPYISRGVISTKLILDTVIGKGYKLYQIEKFVQELAWRDYYQQVWIAKKNTIDTDLKNVQPDVQYTTMPTAIVNATTGIAAIDDGIKDFYTIGYLHNHIRMYIASIVCNIGKCHWLVPAQWMYHHLLDADWASNALSWQWTAASFSNKKYYANQENINKYCNTEDKNTFLDISYDGFATLPVPLILQEQVQWSAITALPITKPLQIDFNLSTLIYNFYNLDCDWKKDLLANRILLLEPSFFTKYTSSKWVVDFVLEFSKNIKGIQLYVGEFAALQKEYNLKNIFFKEHPTNWHYVGQAQSRDWLVPNITGYYPSFFSYWKKIEKYLKATYA